MPLNLATFLFLTSTLQSVSMTSRFNPTTIDFCSWEKCGLLHHIGCLCRILPGREEFPPDVGKFRTEVLHTHNEIREHIASGKAAEDNPLLTSAADMLALSYDLELEYYARCNAGKWPKVRSTPLCDYPTYSDRSALLWAHDSEKDTTAHKKLINLWYESDKRNVTQLHNFIHFMGSFLSFAQLAWSRTNRLGCAMVWYEKLTRSADKGPLGLVCEYGSTLAGDEGVPTPQEPVYLGGTPCTRCPNGTSCENKEFPSLCGKIEPVPVASPHYIRGGNLKASGFRNVNENAVFAISSTLLILFYEL